MPFTTKAIFFALLLPIISLSSGCTWLFGDRPAKVVINVNASKELNPDINGRPSPVVLRIYQLQTDDIFNTARFDDLYFKGDEILGKSLVSVREMNIFPGDKLVINDEEMTLDSWYIGVVVAYRDIDNAIWRGSIATPINEKTLIDLNLGQLSVNIQEVK